MTEGNSLSELDKQIMLIIQFVVTETIKIKLERDFVEEDLKEMEAKLVAAEINLKNIRKKKILNKNVLDKLIAECSSILAEVRTAIRELPFTFNKEVDQPAPSSSKKPTRKYTRKRAAKRGPGRPKKAQ
uniref:Uncharacterized protein n=1 Tax=Panagrolaimus sp. JU765 TaxID=591449 RepID=A0AC34RFG4_9BILA